MAHATLQTFFMMHFVSLHSNIGMWCTSIEVQAETASRGKWQLCSQDWRPWFHAHQCKKVSCDLPGKYHYIYKLTDKVIAVYCDSGLQPEASIQKIYKLSLHTHNTVYLWPYQYIFVIWITELCGTIKAIKELPRHSLPHFLVMIT